MPRLIFKMREEQDRNKQRFYIILLSCAALCILLPLFGVDSIYHNISIICIPLLGGVCLLQKRSAGLLLGAVSGLALMISGREGSWTIIVYTMLTGYIASQTIISLSRVSGGDTGTARYAAAFTTVMAGMFCYDAIPALAEFIAGKLTSPGNATTMAYAFSRVVSENDGIELLLCEAIVPTFCVFFGKKTSELPTVMQKFSRRLLIVFGVSFILMIYAVFSFLSYMDIRNSRQTLQDNLDDIALEIDKLATSSESIKDVAWRWRIRSTGWACITEDGLLVSAPKEAMLGKSVAQIGWQPYGKERDVGSFNGDKVLFAAREHGPYRMIVYLPMSEVFNERDLTSVVLLSFLTCIFILIHRIIMSLCKKHIVGDLGKVNLALSMITSGKLNVRAAVEDTREFQALSNGVNETVDALRAAIAAEAARIDGELEYARQVQLSALPAPMPQNPRFSVAALIRPAKMVGGDFYDHYMLDAEHIVVMAADVCDKGIPAALFMMRAKTAIKELLGFGMKPEQAVSAANERLCEQNEPCMFVTFWLGILDLSSGVMQCVNAGHNPPLLRRQNGETEWVRTVSDIFMGSFTHVKYLPFQITMHVGDTLLLYTDGVNEAENEDGTRYGNPRLFSFMAEHGGGEIASLPVKLLDNIDAFAGKAKQSDDITILCLRYKSTETTA